MVTNAAGASSLPNLRGYEDRLDLHTIAKTITNRQNFCTQLRMGDEIAVEFAQRFGRWLLIQGTDLAGNLATPQKIVADDDATGAQLRQRQIQIAAIFFFDCIDENQIKRF